jgi:hypothetical protein
MNPDHKYYPRTSRQKLGYLVEECGEVMAAVGKTLRWGLESSNPELPPEERETNRAWILRELKDLRQAIALVEEALQPQEPGEIMANAMLDEFRLIADARGITVADLMEEVAEALGP